VCTYINDINSQRVATRLCYHSGIRVYIEDICI